MELIRLAHLTNDQQRWIHQEADGALLLEWVESGACSGDLLRDGAIVRFADAETPWCGVRRLTDRNARLWCCGDPSDPRMPELLSAVDATLPAEFRHRQILLRVDDQRRDAVSQSGFARRGRICHLTSPSPFEIDAFHRQDWRDAHLVDVDGRTIRSAKATRLYTRTCVESLDLPMPSHLPAAEQWRSLVDATMSPRLLLHSGGLREATACLLLSAPSDAECTDWSIAYIGVVPESRRQGQAQNLLEFACDLACNEGGRSLSTWVAADNHPAIALYQSTGFRTTQELEYWCREV